MRGGRKSSRGRTAALALVCLLVTARGRALASEAEDIRRYKELQVSPPGRMGGPLLRVVPFESMDTSAFRYRSRIAGQSGTDVAILTPRTIASAATSAASDPIVVSGRSGFWSFRVDTAKS
jgi:hypothetical protein